MAPLIDASRRRAVAEPELVSGPNPVLYTREEELFRLSSSSPKKVSFGESSSSSSKGNQLLAIDLSSDGNQDPAVVNAAAQSSSTSSSSSSSTFSSTTTSSLATSSSTSTSSSSTVTSTATSTSESSTTSDTPIPTSTSETLTSTSDTLTSPTPTVAYTTTSVLESIVPYTTVDENSQTTVGSSTILSTQLFTMTPTPGSQQQLGANSNNNKKNTGAIAAGGVIGGLCLFGLIAGLIFCILRRNRRRREIEATRVVSPFDANQGGSSDRDLEVQRTIRRVPPPSLQETRAFDGAPVSLQTATLGPHTSHPQDPFADRYQVQKLESEYDQVPLSPGPRHNPGEEMQVKTASAAAFNPFATSVAAFEPRSTPANGSFNSFEKLRGSNFTTAGVTSPTTSTPKSAIYGFAI